MANVDQGDIVRVSIEGTSFGQVIIMTRTYAVTQVGSAPVDLYDFAEAVVGEVDTGGPRDLVTPYVSCLSNDYITQFVSAQVLKPTRGRAFNQERNVPGSLGGAGQANLAGVITLQTRLSGRGQESNMHIGPIPNAGSAGGIITDLQRDAFDNLKDTFLSTIPNIFTNYELTPCIWHSKIPGPSIFYDFIFQGYVQDTTRVMRRRTVRVGI